VAKCDQHAERRARAIEAEIRVLAQSLCVELGLIAREWKFMRRRRARGYKRGRASAANPGPWRVVACIPFNLHVIQHSLAVPWLSICKHKYMPIHIKNTHTTQAEVHATCSTQIDRNIRKHRLGTRILTCDAAARRKEKHELNMRSSGGSAR
jgi:hypothetical protein